ncbi:hypothetical protein ACIOSY_14045, partial [Microbacterium sp. NPDC087665]
HPNRVRDNQLRGRSRGLKTPNKTSQPNRQQSPTTLVAGVMGAAQVLAAGAMFQVWWRLMRKDPAPRGGVSAYTRLKTSAILVGSCGVLTITGLVVLHTLTPG